MTQNLRNGCVKLNGSNNLTAKKIDFVLYATCSSF
jgi:hypothetical protein